MDRGWWDEYQADAALVFNGNFATALIDIYGVEKYNITAGNSGAGSIGLARALGANKIILLGFDCQHTDAKKHWHGDHPETLGNAGTVDKWPAQFEKFAGDDVINCSRKTALCVFSKANLEDVIK